MAPPARKDRALLAARADAEQGDGRAERPPNDPASRADARGQRRRFLNERQLRAVHVDVHLCEIGPVAEACLTANEGRKEKPL
jgi:hypothetical protein